MEVIRDATWTICLTDAMKMYRVSEANEKCYKLADATWKMKMKYIQNDDRRKERSLILLEAGTPAPAVVKALRTSHKLCQATTMAGNPCKFKAVCGDFCKKHKI